MHKNALRKKMLARRTALNPDEVHRLSELAQRRMLDSALWQRARCVALYAAVRGETDTAMLLENAWASGKKVLLPRCLPGHAGLMHFVECPGHWALVKGTYGIPEPCPDLCSVVCQLHAEDTAECQAKEPCPAECVLDNTGLAKSVRAEIEPGSIPASAGGSNGEQDIWPDLLLAPGVAFDRKGYRLGFGGGYYDRLLESALKKMSQRPFALIGLAYAFQIVPDLPHAEWDVPVHALCTDEELLWIA